MSQTQTIKRVLLEVKDLKKYFPIRRGIFRRIVGWIPAVDGISFTLYEGEILGLVGESGCGKTTAIRAIIQAIKPTSGKISFRRDDNLIDITNLKKKELKGVWRKMRMIFQDPDSSLNPRMTIRNIIVEPLIINDVVKGKKKMDRIVLNLMAKVGLNSEYLQFYPHALSGGQRQRVGIARVLALNPKLVFADEPTSALDVSVQSQILNLLLKMQEDMNLSFIFVTHDLRVVRHISDTLAIMYLGQIVEIGKTNKVFANPLHPYTQALISAIPDPDPHRPRHRIILRGEVPDPASRPSGCPFHPRCSYSEAICQKEAPKLMSIDGSNHKVACGLVKALETKRNNQIEYRRTNSE